MVRNFQIPRYPFTILSTELHLASELIHEHLILCNSQKMIGAMFLPQEHAEERVRDPLVAILELTE